MATPRANEARDPQFSNALRVHEAAWVSVFLARASLGLQSVLVVTASAGTDGAVAVVSSIEASALLRKVSDTRGSARVSGTASPGSIWCVGFLGDHHAVWSLALTPILTREPSV